MSITLEELKQRSRERADAENDNHVDSGGELTSYINSSIAELQDLLIQTYEDYFVRSLTFTTSNGVESYALPNGTNYSAAPAFYKLNGVDAKVSGDKFSSLRPFNFNERNLNHDISWGLSQGPNIRYRMLGANLIFSPAPNAAYEIKLWYTPVATKLVADADVYEDQNQFYEYVITDVAIKIMQKGEQDVSVLAAQKLDLRARIVGMASNRDSGQPESISDIHAENDEYWFTRS